MNITEADLRERESFDETEGRVQVVLDGLRGDLPAWVRFVAYYTTFNGCFGSAVAQLAGTIGSARNVFIDPEETLDAVADRSVLVGSYFFDAARDEFDDTKNPARDTHRCLAQAFLKGLIACARGENDAFRNEYASDKSLRSYLKAPGWLDELCARVRDGYGAKAALKPGPLFHAMGYHLGSEVLADQEFSLIDAHLRKEYPKLVAKLAATKIKIGVAEHDAYHWLKSHSGHGDAVEFDHFQWAVEGVDRAFLYTPSHLHEKMKAAVLEGFSQFAADHQTFFERVK